MKEKLIRDKLVLPIRESEKKVRIANHDELYWLLKNKLHEEVDEFLVEFDANHVVKATEEAGDVLQVLVSSIAHIVGKHERIVLDNIIDAYYRKYEERGGFEYMFVLELDDSGTPYV